MSGEEGTAAAIATTTATDANQLLVPKAYELSLSPPRFPPVGSSERALYTTSDGHHAALHRATTQWIRLGHYSVDDTRRRRRTTGDSEQNDTSNTEPPPLHPKLQALLRQEWMLYRRRHHSSRGGGPRHPHVSDSTPHAWTRAVSRKWSLAGQNHFRDSGSFRSTVNGLIVASLPMLAIAHWQSVMPFVALTRSVQILEYGPHVMQRVHLYRPLSPLKEGKEQLSSSHCENGMTTTTNPKLLYFVHGGAWGSGEPYMYRLVAAPFVQCGWTVAIVGYRTYPDAQHVQDQVNDLEGAAAALHTALNMSNPSWTTTVLMGHSSGAHIALLMLVQRAIQSLSVSSIPPRNNEPRLSFCAYIGVSGPYNIAHHFDYEAARGVEEISPLKPIHAFTRAQFWAHSPAHAWARALAAVETTATAATWPSRSGGILPAAMLMVHGIVDDTVPFTATAEAARVLRSTGQSVSEIYLPDTGHQDAVMQIMLGGPVRNVILEWIQALETNSPKQPLDKTVLLQSRL
jgi:acetyl esterase/lipase